MPARSFFPTVLWQEPLKLPAKFHERLAEECYAFREMDDVGLAWSRKNYAAGYTSYSSLSDLPDRSPTFAKLRARIDREVTRYAKRLEMDLQGGKLVMSTCWMNIMGRNSHHSFHLHPLSAISGTFYVRVPKGAGCFKIEDPRIAGFMGSPPRRRGARPENRRYLEIRPREGDVLLFESWLKHEVPANLSDEDRVSVSFNYDWV